MSQGVGGGSKQSPPQLAEIDDLVPEFQMSANMPAYGDTPRGAPKTNKFSAFTTKGHKTIPTSSFGPSGAQTSRMRGGVPNLLAPADTSQPQQKASPSPQRGKALPFKARIGLSSASGDSDHVGKPMPVDTTSSNSPDKTSPTYPEKDTPSSKASNRFSEHQSKIISEQKLKIEKVKAVSNTRQNTTESLPTGSSLDELEEAPVIHRPQSHQGFADMTRLRNLTETTSPELKLSPNRGLRVRIDSKISNDKPFHLDYNP